MGQTAQTTALDVIESLNGWWKLAGVDAAVGDQSVNRLADDAEEKAASAASSAVKADPAPPVVAAPSVEWPTEIAELKQMISEGAPLPGNGFSSVHIPPVGPDDADIMIISDLPDAGDAYALESQNSETAILLRHMLAAIDIDMSTCYRTWLATTAPSTGEVPEDMLDALGDFVRHQMQIIRPKSVMILGSSACRALLNDDLMNARAQLRNINHDGSNMATLTTFHPRTLIARPAMKSQAWKDLQMFAKRSAS